MVDSDTAVRHLRHDLRGQMNAIRLACELLDFPLTPGDAVETREGIATAAERAERTAQALVAALEAAEAATASVAGT